MNSAVRAFTTRLVIALLLLGTAGSPAAGVQSTTRPNADIAIDAISRLKSPFCPGFMLEVCTSPNAAALRDSIYVLAAQGETSEEIVEWMLANHGEEWRAVPKASGVGLLAWIIPPLAVLAAVWFALGWLRRNRINPTGAVPATAHPAAVTDQDRERLATAMREWEESGQEEA